MKETIEGRDRVNVARKRENEFLARAVQQSDELAAKSRKLGTPTVTDTASIPVQVNGAGCASTTVADGPERKSLLPQGVPAELSAPSMSMLPSSSGSADMSVLPSSSSSARPANTGTILPTHLLP